ncbi:MAG: hypothetical protein WDZ34_00775 [Candidatus Saccharimonadales bacterium]
MWDFLLVLGQVPGTKFVITFSEVVGFCILTPLLWAARKKYLHTDLRRTIRLLTVHLRSKKGQQLRLPV